jgi:RimJ/RimL family protein N-acetyltransferase
MLTAMGSWALRGYGMWALEETASGRFIGSVGLFEPLDWPEPEIAYSLDEPYWHRGFATEAAGAARDWTFAHFPHRRLASFIRPENQASIRVAERLGAILEGTAKLRGVAFQHWVHHRPG